MKSTKPERSTCLEVEVNDEMTISPQEVFSEMDDSKLVDCTHFTVHRNDLYPYIVSSENNVMMEILQGAAPSPHLFGKGFYLSSFYEWKLVNHHGNMCLIPIKKY